MVAFASAGLISFRRASQKFPASLFNEIAGTPFMRGMKDRHKTSDELDAFVNDFVRDRLRRLRQAKGLSVKEAAARSGIPAGSYANLENGFYRICLPNLYRILRALDIDLSEVWSPPEGNQAIQTERVKGRVQLVEIKQVNLFRLQEIYVLSNAEAAAVLVSNGHENIRCLYSLNLDGSTLEKLSRLHKEELPGWQIYTRRQNGLCAYLCLKTPDSDACKSLKLLLRTYLDLWLAGSQI